MISGTSVEKQSGSRIWLGTLIAIIVFGSLFLVFPVYREYGKRCDEYARLKAEHSALQAELQSKQETVSDLEKTPSAVEKVAREKFNQGGPGETTYIYETSKPAKK